MPIILFNILPILATNSPMENLWLRGRGTFYRGVV